MKLADYTVKFASWKASNPLFDSRRG